MKSFFDLYSSFDDFFESFFKGNEFEFVYKQRRYYILPSYVEGRVKGIILGISNEDKETLFLSKESLYLAPIEESFLGNILKEIEIVWHNI